MASWGSQDEAWASVVGEMRRLVEDWQGTTGSTDDDTPPSDEFSVGVETDRGSTITKSAPIEPGPWVRRDNFDEEWTELKQALLDHVNSLADLHKKSGIAVTGRFWGDKLLLDLNKSGMRGYRRIWIQDIGGNPNYPGYQIYVSADDRLRIAPERLRWMFMSDQLKYLLPVAKGAKTAFTAETYARHLWELINKAA